MGIRTSGTADRQGQPHRKFILLAGLRWQLNLFGVESVGRCPPVGTTTSASSEHGEVAVDMPSDSVTALSMQASQAVPRIAREDFQRRSEVSFAETSTNIELVGS